MCIRDRYYSVQQQAGSFDFYRTAVDASGPLTKDGSLLYRICLLYTSDAADERSSVDLGGRRIIKKKKRKEIGGVRWIQ